MYVCMQERYTDRDENIHFQKISADSRTCRRNRVMKKGGWRNMV